jgi:predicted TIM-barrel fold metal-dependent hydrolase
LVNRIISLEDHFLSRAYRERLGEGGGHLSFMVERARNDLEDVGAIRLREMDRAGIDMQVITEMGSQLPLQLTPSDSILLTRESNDELAAAIASHSDRFAGFATLPMAEPKEAEVELERSVKTLGMKGAMIYGTIGGQFLDSPEFFPILERASALNVPIYIHPGYPPESVREAYYSGFDPAVSIVLAGPGWGWHQEAALHILRLTLSGIFDKLPDFRVIIGHMGETLPFMLERADCLLSQVSQRNLRKPIKNYLLENVYITTSGFFSEPLLTLALKTFGADRIMFSVDYPFERNEIGTAFLTGLSTINAEDKEKIAHLNAERVLKI